MQNKRVLATACIAHPLPDLLVNLSASKQRLPVMQYLSLFFMLNILHHLCMRFGFANVNKYSGSEMGRAAEIGQSWQGRQELIKWLLRDVAALLESWKRKTKCPLTMACRREIKQSCSYRSIMMTLG